MNTLHLQLGSDGVAIVTIDVPRRAMNVVTAEFMADLDELIRRIGSDPAVQGAVLTSGKTNGFLAGADLVDLCQAYGHETPQQAQARSTRLSGLFRRLETCGKPVAAAINGLALGGGLELALACHYRVLSDHPKAIVGLPEVTVGLLPGAGGTQRLPRLIGIPAALPILQSGAPLSPAEALKSGIVHGVLLAAELVAAARRWVLEHQQAQQPWDQKGFRVPGGAGCLAGHAVESFQIGTSRVARTTQRNYPAPLAILSAVFEGTQVPLDTGLRIESKYFAKLLTDPVARNLMRTMFIHRKDAEKLVRRSAAVPRATIRRVGVLGAGLMGSGIGYAAAAAGIEVVLLDATLAQAAAGRDYSERLLAKQLAAGRTDAAQVATILGRITPTTEYRELGGCDLIIEAVFEDDATKRGVLARAAAAVGREAILASNTSTLSISRLAVVCPSPERFIGIHLFSPVERMPLVEIIRGRRTGERALAVALDLAGQLRKTPIVVNDSPGFFTSRVFGAFVDEGMAMLAEGVLPAAIENAARMAGMPVGPLAVCDEVSIELQLRVHESAVANRLPPKFQRLTAIDVVKAMVARGRRGRRSGGGFYEYPEGGRKHLWPGLREIFPPAAVQPDVMELRSRFLVIQALETVRCVEEGVVDYAADADVGSILGIGYPSWTGGTLSYIETVGLAEFAATCARLARRHGHRFRPSGAFGKRVAAGRGFYDEAGATRSEAS